MDLQSLEALSNIVVRPQHLLEGLATVNYSQACGESLQDVTDAMADIGKDQWPLKSKHIKMCRN